MSALVLGVFLTFPASATAADTLQDKMGVYVTPWTDGDSRFPVGYSDALKALHGHASTVWILENWAAIETAPGQFEWDALDAQVNRAVDAGFNLGLRIQIILSGNNAQKRWVGVPRIPRFYSQNMGSQQFREKAAAFYSQVAQRYKGKARYIAVGNSVNKFFEKNHAQWVGFQQSYNAIVDAIHQAAPKILVVADVSPEGKYLPNQQPLKKYVDFFAHSHDDMFGLVFYFIVAEYYGGDFRNFNIATLRKVLDSLHSMAPQKKLFIIETACFSKHPKTGADISGVQTNYLDMLLTIAKEKDYLAGVCWWQLYDAKDLPGVAWDLKATFGLFDSSGQPKPAWNKWILAYAGE